jgi:hypothetical protein
MSNEAYRWVVLYNDGTAETEDVLGGWANVQQDKLVGIQLLPNRSGLHQHVVYVNTQEGQRGIVLRKRIATVDPLAQQEIGGRQTIHCIGWQKTVEGTNVKSMLWVFDDGSTILTDRDIQDIR